MRRVVCGLNTNEGSGVPRESVIQSGLTKWQKGGGGAPLPGTPCRVLGEEITVSCCRVHSMAEHAYRGNLLASLQSARFSLYLQLVALAQKGSP